METSMSDALEWAMDTVEKHNVSKEDKGIVTASLIIWNAFNELDYHLLCGTDKVCGIGEGVVMMGDAVSRAISELADEQIPQHFDLYKKNGQSKAEIDLRDLADELKKNGVEAT